MLSRTVLTASVAKSARPTFARYFTNKSNLDANNEPEFGHSLDTRFADHNSEASNIDPKNLKKTSKSMPEYPGWKEELASQSEAVVKADRSEQGIEDMKKQTIKVLNKQSKASEKQL